MKEETFLTLKAAVAYLDRTRKLKVTRQTLHTLVQRNQKECKRLGDATQPALWLIPTSLLDAYILSDLHQKNGNSPKTKKK